MTEKKQPHEADTYTAMTADVYNTIYSGKNYEAEAKALENFIDLHKKTSGNELLDIACGTGLHLPYLTDKYQITGVDLSEQQLDAARKRLPDLTFFQGNMRDFNLHHQFDVVTCLFSSIGYVFPYEDLQKTIQNMANHLKPGGVLIIEPWLQPGVFDPNRPSITETREHPDMPLKVSRTTRNSIEGNISVMEMHHLVERPEGSEEFTEVHRLALYTPEQFFAAFEGAGLKAQLDEQGLSNRGLYIATK